MYYLVVDPADIKTLPTWHNINPATLWPAAYKSVNVTKCLKFLVPKWSKQVPKLIWWWSRKWHRDHSGTEMDMYRNGLPHGPKVPERDRYRTWPNLHSSDAKLRRHAVNAGDL